MKTILLACVIAWPLLGYASEEGDETVGYFWAPPLPNGQEFVALRRAIKSYRLLYYDTYFQGDRYPTTELNIEMTHQTVRFIFIDKSQGHRVEPSLKDIAAGKFDENGSFDQHAPPRAVPANLKKHTKEELGQVRFLMNSAGEVEKMYSDLDRDFHLFYPW